MEKELVKAILDKKSNNYFRQTLDKSNSNYLFDNQINSAREIVIDLASNVLRTNHVMLLAKMQSGKTGVCNSVVNILIKSKLYQSMAINKYFFVSGMNDCGLKDQTYQRVISQIEAANVDNTYFGKRCKRNLSTNKFFVLKNSDLLSYDGILDNSIIFIDESHYGSNEKNVLSKFFAKHNINWKNTNDLISRNIYIVSVSATPFEELVSDTINCKKSIELVTDNKYVGVSDYIKHDLIYDANRDDITENGEIFDYIEDAETRMFENGENGIIIIRTRNFDVIKENQYVQNNFDIFEMCASGSKIEYNKLNNIMHEMYEENRRNRQLYSLGCEDEITSRPLIVLIKGAFRAGITISEEYKDMIYMIYDYSCKSSTTAQAMLGRMCGYRNDATLNTYFYINAQFAHMYSAWEKDFKNKDLIPCDKTSWSWVDNNYEGNDVRFSSKSRGNFAIDLSDEDIKNLYLLNKGKRNRNKLANMYLTDILAKYGFNINYDYIGECHMSGKNSYAKSSQTKRFDSFSETSLVFPFRADKLQSFRLETERDYLTKEDLGKSCVSLVLDTNIYDNGNDITIDGNKRLLVYNVEVGQQKLMANRSKQYQTHKDTALI